MRERYLERRRIGNMWGGGERRGREGDRGGRGVERNKGRGGKREKEMRRGG